MEEKSYLRLMFLSPLPIIVGLGATSVALLPFAAFSVILLYISRKMSITDIKAIYRLLPIYLGIPYLIYFHFFVKSFDEPIFIVAIITPVIVIGYVLVATILLINWLMYRDVGDNKPSQSSPEE